MSQNLALLTLGVLIGAAAARAQDPGLRTELEQIRERLDEIEEQQIHTSERVGDRSLVQAFSADAIDLGGHVSSLFSHIEGDSDRATGHLVTLTELFLKAEIDEHWSLFSAPGFYSFNGGLLDNPATPTVAGDPVFIPDNATTENLFLARVYAQWRPSDLLQVQGGIVGSPHGPSNREYFIPARSIAAANLHTRAFLANQLYPQVVRGLKASGKWVVGSENWVEYDAYFGTDEERAADGVAGLRIGYSFAETGLTVSAGYGRGTRQASTTPSTNFGILQSPFTQSYFTTRDYEFGGLDVDWRTGAIIFKGEAYYSAEEGFRDQRALSAEFTWFAVPEFALTYRYDFYDRGADVMMTAPVVASLGHSTEHVLGLLYAPHPDVRIRLDLHHNNLPNTSADVQFANVSWSISF